MAPTLKGRNNMNFPRDYSLQQLAKLIKARSWKGPENLRISGINEIHRIKKGQLLFVDHPKYYDKALQSEASALIIDKEIEFPPEKGMILSENPFRDFDRLIRHFFPFQKATEYVSKKATIGKNTYIGPGVFLGNHVIIGQDCHIHPNVTIHPHTVIGDEVIIQSGTVLGSDAFYYQKHEGSFIKLHSGGVLHIKDRVEIGSCCTIDRGITDETLIDEGSKLDNLIQIGHDTRIGKNCLIASHTGIAGCCTLEDQVILWGQVGISSGLFIGKGAVVLAQSGVSKNLEGNKTYFGYPAQEVKVAYRSLATLRELSKNSFLGFPAKKLHQNNEL